jgi:hypothetical protein
MLTNPSVIATKAVSGDVCVFDYTRHASMPAAGQVSERKMLDRRSQFSTSFRLLFVILDKSNARSRM